MVVYGGRSDGADETWHSLWRLHGQYENVTLVQVCSSLGSSWQFAVLVAGYLSSNELHSRQVLPGSSLSSAHVPESQRCRWLPIFDLRSESWIASSSHYTGHLASPSWVVSAVRFDFPVQLSLMVQAHAYHCYSLATELGPALCQSHTSALSPTLPLDFETPNPQSHALTAGHRGPGLRRELEPHHRHCPQGALGRGDCL